MAEKNNLDNVIPMFARKETIVPTKNGNNVFIGNYPAGTVETVMDINKFNNETLAFFKGLKADDKICPEIDFIALEE